MASKYSEYSRLRSIARKRAERLSEAGLSRLITFPSVKELKAAGVKPEQAVRQVESYLQAPTQTRQYRRMDEQQRPVFVQEGLQVVVTEKSREQTERRRAQNRESARRYRERVKKLNATLSKAEKSWIKAARTLGLHITPSQAKVYVEYIYYRFEYGSSKLKYRMATYVEDFEEILVKRGKYGTKDLMKDFNLYLKNRAELENRKRKPGQIFGNKYGYTGEEIESIFSDFIYS